MSDIPVSNAVKAYKAAQSMGPMAGSGGGTENQTPIGQSSFSQMVEKSLTDAQGVGYKSEITSLESIAKKASPVDLVTAVSQAELTLQTVVAVRDKVINAYQEILKMPI